jgi:hypothetical protein
MRLAQKANDWLVAASRATARSQRHAPELLVTQHTFIENTTISNIRQRTHTVHQSISQNTDCQYQDWALKLVSIRQGATPGFNAIRDGPLNAGVLS